jgi:4-diphosphocytidyl-2-C-methyl-D-erythritol kinase
MTVSAYAKVNFTLEVLGTRADGYHTLRSLVVPVSLADTLTIEPAETLSSDTGYADDLILKAARVLQAACGVRAGASVSVVKRIPAGGGLGGGSADAAATLLALNRLWGLGLSRPDLTRLAADVGSDVPALVQETPVLLQGRGEVVSPFRLPDGSAFPRLHLVLANPRVHCSTPVVFARCTSRVTDDPSIVYNMQTSLVAGDLSRIAAALMNDLQAPACALHPEIAAALRLLTQAGALGATMSGSGSTVFGLVPDEARGREAAAFLNGKGLSAWSVHVPVP